MWCFHLRILLWKSVLYAWRHRSCRCCPKIVFELILPLVGLLMLCLIRWSTSTPSLKSRIYLPSNTMTPSLPMILPEFSFAFKLPKYVLQYEISPKCPANLSSIQFTNEADFKWIKNRCPSMTIDSNRETPGYWIAQKIRVEKTGKTISAVYQCSPYSDTICKNGNDTLNSDRASITHPAHSVCKGEDESDISIFLKVILQIQSLFNTVPKVKKLSVHRWLCTPYWKDTMLDFNADFTFIFLLILIDLTILYSFNLLIHGILKEKKEGVTELLRLISIQPILNSFAWFIRVFVVQTIVSLFLIIILKSSFDQEVILPHVPIYWIFPSIFLWTIQTLSRSVLLGQIFNTDLKASAWSWFTYLISFWLATTKSFRLPLICHLFASAWLPFYSIKRIFVYLFRINIDLGRQTNNQIELLLIWLCITAGTILMWLAAYYFEQVRPGKYGIPRPWCWPIESLRKMKRRQSVDMCLVQAAPEQNVTVRVNNLTKSYGNIGSEEQLAVNHISFKLEKSKIYGLIGHNGAGKTTTMEMLCGILPWDSGTIEIHDKDLEENLDELRNRIGYCSQEDILFSFLTVKEQLEFYIRVRNRDSTKNHLTAHELLRMMDMDEYSDRLCRNLSGGMKRKLSILCAFAGDANIIILDEPSSSLDPVARRALWNWLRENRENRTLLVSSHLLDEVEELCDSIIILDSGVVRAEGTILELKNKFGPPGDRIHVDRIPDYLPKSWIIDEKNLKVQVPDRNSFIDLLERLEKDEIKYSLDNVTLDEIFLKLTSTSSVSEAEESLVESKIRDIFQVKTETNKIELWIQQILAVLIRRGHVLLRRARLLPIVLLIYLTYTLWPYFVPSLNLKGNEETTEYLVSARTNTLFNMLPTQTMNIKRTAWYASNQTFRQHLSEIPLWQSDYKPPKRLIGLRIASNRSLECFVPSPILANTVKWCLPIFSAFSNVSSISVEFNQSSLSSFRDDIWNDITVISHSQLFYCFHTLPISAHESIVLLYWILVVCVAFAVQDHSSRIHGYTLIHGLCPIIHWLIIFIIDLIICLTWWCIVVLLSRFLHASHFDGAFFGLSILFYVITLPFTYILAKLFKQPVLGSMAILCIILIAHALATFRILFQFLQDHKKLAVLIRMLRWLFIIIFPNTNVLTLIAAILKPDDCAKTDSHKDVNKIDADEVYEHKILIHILIFLAQFISYFVILCLIDTLKIPDLFGREQGIINKQEEDNDVVAERERIESMKEEDKCRETLVVDNLTKKYRGTKVPAVNRLTIGVARRECFGLLGFNGSGKTTTFRMLVGDLYRSNGTIYRNKKERLGYCPQDDVDFSSLTVIETINYICRIHGIQPWKLNQLLLERFQLEEYTNRLVSHLSGGTRRRLHLALCLIGSPSLLILDEPTAKVDPTLRSHIRLVLHHRPVDTSIVFASHSMLECEQLCDRLTILVRGNARCLGSTRHLKEKYGTDYRVRLTVLDSSFNVPDLRRVDDSGEYSYPKTSLYKLYKILEDLVQQNKILSNYTVQLTSLEHIFLSFQHTEDTSL